MTVILIILYIFFYLAGIFNPFCIFLIVIIFPCIFCYYTMYFNRTISTFFASTRYLGPTSSSIANNGKAINQRNFTTASKPTEARSKSSSGGLKVTLASPHRTFLNRKEVSKVRLPGSTGEIGILSDIPTGEFENITELQSGVVTITRIEDNIEKEERFLISGGFAFVHNEEGHFSLSVPEATPVHMDDFGNEVEMKAPNQKQLSSISCQVKQPVSIVSIL